MMGQMPGQNTAATTMMASLEQGMQVFSAIYKRTFRSMTNEFRMWFELSLKYIDPEMFENMKGMVVPVADPNIVSATQRMMKAQALIERATVAPHLYGNEGMLEAERRFLEALQVEGLETLLHPGEFQDPQAQAQQAETEANMQVAQDESQREWVKTQANAEKDQATIKSKAIDDEVKQRDISLKEVKVAMEHEIEKRKVGQGRS
jgi:chaperonin GroES